MKKKFTIGADPEFLFAKDNQLVRAKEIILDKDCGFGFDGGGTHATIGEIRPGYSTSVMEVVVKIENILIQAERKLPISKKADAIVAGHFKWDQPMGGHIHIGYPNIGESYENFEKLGLALDHFIHDCLEDLVAPKIEREHRIGKRFGQPFRRNQDSIRTKDLNRIEYRAPGSWLISPNVTYAYLYVAKGLMALFDAGLTYGEIVAPGNVAGMRGRINRLKGLSKQISKVDGSEDMGLGRELLFDLIEGDEIDWTADIRKNWIG